MYLLVHISTHYIGCLGPILNYIFYRQTVDDYVDIPLSQASRLFDIKGFNKDNPTVLYIHGFIELAQQESIQVSSISKTQRCIIRVGCQKRIWKSSFS